MSKITKSVNVIQLVGGKFRVTFIERSWGNIISYREYYVSGASILRLARVIGDIKLSHDWKVVKGG